MFDRDAPRLVTREQALSPIAYPRAIFQVKVAMFSSRQARLAE